MHSSRMRTARLLTICRSIRDGEYVCLGRVSVQWGIGGWGCLLRGVRRCLPRGEGVCLAGLGVSAGGWGCLPRGVSAQGGVCLGSVRLGGLCPIIFWDTFPVNRLTDRCKNIILSQTSFEGSKYNVQKRSQLTGPLFPKYLFLILFIYAIFEYLDIKDILTKNHQNLDWLKNNN